MQGDAVIQQIPGRIFILLLREHISLLDGEHLNMGFG